MKRVFWCWLINVTGSCCWQLSGNSVRSVSWTTYTWFLQEGGLRVVRLLHWWLTSGKTMFQENQEEAVAPFMTQPQKLHTITSSGFYGAKQSQIHIMSIVTSVHLRIVRCHQIKKRCHIQLLLVKIFRVEESPFLEVEKPTMGSLQLMRRLKSWKLVLKIPDELLRR